MRNRLIAIGDIHGCFDKFRALLEDHIQLQKEDQLILLGDYIDRGSQSREVIDYIIHLQEQGFDLTPLLGNHEAMLLNAFDDEHFLSLWLYNGGLETLESFGVKYLKDLPLRYIDFLKTLPFYYSQGNYLFVHAGFNDEAEDPFEDIYPMLWQSRSIYSHPDLAHKTIVHGHSTITLNACMQNVYANKPVLNMDTGCVFSEESGYGNLTAIDLHSRIIFSV